MWPIWGRSLVKALLAHLVYSDERDRTLAKLMDGINRPEGKMPELLRGIYNVSNSRMARAGASSLMQMRADETFSGIYANARGATEWLNIGSYADLTSGDTMRTSDILDANTVVFVQIPLQTLQSTPTLGRTVMGALFNAMYLADGSVGDRILFVLDEAWSLGAMREVELCLATARKYRGTLNLVFPSAADIETIWTKSGAQAMRDKCSWQSFNAIQDVETAERLSRALGSRGVLAYSEGVNSGAQKPWGMHMPSSSSGTNANTHEVKRELMMPDEILRAPADQMYVLARDFPYAIRCWTAPYWRYPDIRDRMRDNRFVAAAN
jgi:type IV secretion system protein VirD4